MTFNDKERIKAYLSLYSNVTVGKAKKVISDLMSEKQYWHLADDWRDFFLDSIYEVAEGQVIGISKLIPQNFQFH